MHQPSSSDKSIVVPNCAHLVLGVGATPVVDVLLGAPGQYGDARASSRGGSSKIPYRPARWPIAPSMRWRSPHTAQGRRGVKRRCHTLEGSVRNSGYFAQRRKSRQILSVSPTTGFLVPISIPALIMHCRKRSPRPFNIWTIPLTTNHAAVP